VHAEEQNNSTIKDSKKLDALTLVTRDLYCVYKVGDCRLWHADRSVTHFQNHTVNTRSLTQRTQPNEPINAKYHQDHGQLAGSPDSGKESRDNYVHSSLSIYLSGALLPKYSMMANPRTLPLSLPIHLAHITTISTIRKEKRMNWIFRPSYRPTHNRKKTRRHPPHILEGCALTMLGLTSPVRRYLWCRYAAAKLQPEDRQQGWRRH
jgi:hypothetical protein